MRFPWRRQRRPYDWAREIPELLACPGERPGSHVFRALLIIDLDGPFDWEAMCPELRRSVESRPARPNLVG